MENNFIIKRFENSRIFLTETQDFLHEQEILNSIFLTTLQSDTEKQQSSSSSSSFGCTLYDTTANNQIIFALFALKGSFLYASGIAPCIPQEQYEPIVKMLVTDFLARSFPFNAIQSYEPVLDLLKQNLEQEGNMKFKFLDNVWSYDIKQQQVSWSSKSLKIRDSPATELKEATIDDLPLLAQWTRQFLIDVSENMNHHMFPGVEQMCLEDLEKNKHIYILYIDETPVSMTWKRRPLRDGCSIANVYTPQEFRGKGYGAVCVSLCTELFLQDYKYVTLFALGTRDPGKNMYTSVGYQFLGKAGRYAVVFKKRSLIFF